MRVDELAGQLGVSVGAVLDACDAAGLDAEGRSSALTVEEQERVRRIIEADAPGASSGKERGTRREAPSAGTRRETAGASSKGRTGDGEGWLRLPAEMSEEFELLHELRHGGEGFVVVVLRKGTDEHLVLKGYHQGFDVDSDSLADLRSRASVEHVVRIVDHGTLQDGSFFELQEYLEAGSLRDLYASEGKQALQFSEIVSEVSRALAHVHELGIVHRDVKPENILVRSTEPLDLVLADFGLVRQVMGSVRHTTRAGTAEYSPPEAVASRVEVSPAWDWWSLGMILAELFGGGHPLALPDGSFPTADDMRAELAQRPVDLQGLTDERERLLCAGLLVRDRRKRWGWVEVSEWLAGESPLVADESVMVDDTVTTRPKAQVLYQGSDIADPVVLAAAFQEDWADAMRLLFQEPDPVLIEETVALCRACGRDDAARMVVERPTGDGLVRHFARFLIELDPQLAPRFDGVDLTPSGLEATARAVLDRDDVTAAKVLVAVERAQVLRTWRHLDGMADAGRIQAEWNAHMAEVNRLAPGGSMALQADERQRLTALLLLVALDTRHLDDLRSRLAKSDQAQAGEAVWWRRLADDPSSPAAALALVTQPRAAAEVTEAHERERQQREEDAATLAAEQAAAEKRRLDEKRKARLAREEEQRQAAVAKARKSASTARTLVSIGFFGFWCILPVPLLLVGLPWAVVALSQAAEVNDDRARRDAGVALAIGLVGLIPLYLVATMSWFD